ncbi:MAG: hypothetical protein MK096_13895 [Oleiphilaceae bacterium]|nr:hypothetical protein [Oleiphilaceae bacterium]
MNLAKFILQKIGIGFLYGVGFVLGAWAIGILVNGTPNYFESEAAKTTVNESRINQSLNVVSSSVQIKPDYANISGEVFNLENDLVNQANIELYLLNKEDEMLHKCTHLLNKPIPPKETVNFSFVCNGFAPSLYKNFGSHQTYAVK